MRKIIILLCLFCFGMLFLGAQEDADGAAATAETEETAPIAEDSLVILDNSDSTGPAYDGTGSSFSFWDFVKMILILVVVILLIVGVFYLLKKAGGTRFVDTDLIQILSTKNLSGNKHVHLVEVGGQFLLIGSADNSVNLLTQVTDQEAIDQLRLNLSGEKAQIERRNFLDVLGSVFSKNGGSISSTNENPADFIRSQKDRLKNL